MIQLNKLIRSVLAFSVALAILLCTPLTGFAFPGKFPDTNRTGSITLTLKDSDGNIVAGGEISLYEVASLKIESGSAAYVLTDEFENCTVTLNVTDTSLAGILAQYVEDYHVSGTSEILGSDGTVKFDSLELGLYLVVQTVISDDGQTFNPFVVTVPFEVDGEWEYEVDASPKPALVSFTDDQETEGSEETTNPEETTDTEESTNPEETTVSEEGTNPEGTTDTEEGTNQEGTTDTEEGTEPKGTTDTEEGTEPKGTTDTEESTNPEETATPEESTDSEEPTAAEGSTDPGESAETEGSGSEEGETTTAVTLPQTGQLNWPIPVLAAGGILLFAFGWFLKESGRNRQGI